MHQPLESVTALARFSFTPTELAVAKQALLAEQDWSAWIEQIELHGLSGFANKHIEAYDLPVPQALKLPLKALNVRHRSASEARYQALSDINRAFKNHDIPYLALKGAALLPRLYQDPHLRPMRDMDLLLATSHENQAAAVLRELGYDLPEEQPSRFMRDMHQLPNATKTVNGFTCSVELHRDGISREVVGHLHYPMDASQLQSLRWQALEVPAFDDVTMLHQVCRHLEGLHPGGVLKLINVMDVIGLAEIVLQKGDWSRLESAYPHVINSLSCLHLLTPLPQTLQSSRRCRKPCSLRYPSCHKITVFRVSDRLWGR